MDKIKDIIREVISKISEKKFESQDKIERIWYSILEKQELKHTRFVGIKNGQVSVHVDSPAWLYQMKMKKNKILKRLKDEVPEVVNLYFRIGKVK